MSMSSKHVISKAPRLTDDASLHSGKQGKSAHVAMTPLSLIVSRQKWSIRAGSGLGMFGLRVRS
jgi:hypothetical protein